MNYPRIILAGTNSGVGKTTFTLGLILALLKKGIRVQPFKAGPDYIDPTYHTLASSQKCRNLDTWMLSSDAVLELFERQAKLSDISIIEGVMGLYDGYQGKEQGSTAHLAKILKSSVILILNARSLSSSAGAIALGYKQFDRDVDLKGVILNNIASASHYQSIKDVIEKKVGLPVLGFLPKDKSLIMPQRHLGLIPTDEKKPLDDFLNKVRELVEKNIDVDRIISISKNSKCLPNFKKRLFVKKPMQTKINIAIAKDAAFNFYYQDNLDILKHNGVNIIEFSPLKSRALPKHISGVYIGGGFPELFTRKLANNVSLKNDILKRAAQGLPIYAECGGLIYLMKDIANLPMVGIFNFSVKMNKKLSALGYVDIKVNKGNVLSKKGDGIRGHMFHWSYINPAPKKINFAYKVKKNKNICFGDGFLKWNVLASYSHIHFGSNLIFANNFIESCAGYAKNIKNK